MGKLIDVDMLKFPNIAIFDMKLHGAVVPMVRLLDLQMLVPAADIVPAAKLLTLQEVAEHDGAVLVECRSEYLSDAWMLFQGEHRPNFVFVNHRGITVYGEIERYGKTWRCWSSRPSKADQEAAPWAD